MTSYKPFSNSELARIKENNTFIYVESAYGRILFEQAEWANRLAEAAEKHCSCVGLSYQGEHTSQCLAVRKALKAYRGDT